MSDIFHAGLANGGWEVLPLVSQMANIGSEVGRAFSWRGKNREERANDAACRALELFDFSLSDAKNRERLREIARAREVFVDSFFGDNEYGSTPELWQSYFLAFSTAARQGK